MNPGLVLLPVTAIFAFTVFNHKSPVRPSSSPESSKEPPSERLERLFAELIQNEAFSNEWIEVNKRLHTPIHLIASPPEGDKNYQKFAAIRLTKCPQGLPVCEHNSSKIAHGFNMYVNADPATPDHEVKFSILFEMYNVKHWQEHLQITKEAKQVPQEASSDELAVRREQVEWAVLQDARKLAEMIDSKICDEALYPWEDFKSYLAAQKATGHFDRAKSEIEKLKV